MEFGGFVMILLHGISEGPSDVDPEATSGVEEACKEMLRIRHLENVLHDLFLDKKIRGFCHLSIGQESVPVGISMHLGKKDVVICSYRCHGYALATGMDAQEVISEMLGSVQGCARGKGGSMHLYGPRFLGGHGIVGAQVPLGLGAAFAQKYRLAVGRENPGFFSGDKEGDPVGAWTTRAWQEAGNGDGVTVAVFGDGAANQGQIFESANIAALLKLPIVFVCENNQYGMGTHVGRASASPEMYNRFSFLPGIQANASDVLQVAEIFRFARSYALERGPVIIEYLTYRYNGHSMTDAFSGYRNPQEIEDRKASDPITHAARKLEQSGTSMSRLDEEAAREMQAASSCAAKSPRHSGSELYRDILLG